MTAFTRPVAAGAFDADRAEPAAPDLPGQRLIRRLEPQSLKLVEQCDPPQMRVLDQPSGHIVQIRRERVEGTIAHPRFPLTVQIVPDRFPVPADMTGDRSDRPALPAKRVDIHVVLPCDHEKWVSFELVSGQRPPASKETHPRWRSHTGGEFQ